MLDKLIHFHHRLLAWYRAYRRDLPWRVRLDAKEDARPDPYHVLVSEAMLQQTQVATVVPYFLRFIQRFPTLTDLADAPEQDVLRLWQGLGYYSRASRLRETAKIVVRQHGGHLPRTVPELLQLPGIGRYTAGAIASLAFEQQAPILDGNVTRVLCRLDGIEQDPRSSPALRESLWDRARQILPHEQIGDFNSALMELGATVCAPRAPQCALCPVQPHCSALARGAQQRIPPAAPVRKKTLERRWTLCIGRGQRWLIEQRPRQGRWAGLWQFVTITAGPGSPTPAAVRQKTALPVSKLRYLGSIRHHLTHRRYEFEVFLCAAGPGRIRPAANHPRRVWITLDQLSDYPLPKPHLRIAAMLHTLPTRAARKNRRQRKNP
jgi:A/G-specific adenine glycosylase